MPDSILPDKFRFNKVELLNDTVEGKGILFPGILS